MITALFLTNALATWFLTGLIWTIQCVHYPLFARVGAEAFPAYESEHTRRITWIVGPPMLLELVTSAALVVWRPAEFGSWWAWSGLALVGIVWVSTVVLQVPQHERLAKGFDANAHRLLVLSNWVRTAAWSARAALILYAFVRIWSIG